MGKIRSAIHNIESAALLMTADKVFERREDFQAWIAAHIDEVIEVAMECHRQQYEATNCVERDSCYLSKKTTKLNEPRTQVKPESATEKSGNAH